VQQAILLQTNLTVKESTNSKQCTWHPEKGKCSNYWMGIHILLKGIYSDNQKTQKKREKEKTPNNQNARVGVDIMQIIHTLNCCGKALSPKSEIFKFPALSRSKFSGCQNRGKQETYNIRTEMTESKVKLSFARAEGNADYLHTAKAKKKTQLHKL
jgi:hypothetical protein